MTLQSAHVRQLRQASLGTKIDIRAGDTISHDQANSVPQQFGSMANFVTLAQTHSRVRQLMVDEHSVRWTQTRMAAMFPFTALFQKPYKLDMFFWEGERKEWDEKENERGRDRERRKALWVRCRENFERKLHRQIWTYDGSAQQERKSRVVTSQPNPPPQKLSFLLGAAFIGSKRLCCSFFQTK